MNHTEFRNSALARPDTLRSKLPMFVVGMAMIAVNVYLVLRVL